MNPVARFFTVTALGSLLSAATTLAVWPTVRGPGAITTGLAFAAASTKLLDDHLAKRPRAVWTAIAIGLVSGATAWATLALLRT
jgi:hypothetical protein